MGTRAKLESLACEVERANNGIDEANGQLVVVGQQVAVVGSQAVDIQGGVIDVHDLVRALHAELERNLRPHMRDPLTGTWLIDGSDSYVPMQSEDSLSLLEYRTMTPRNSQETIYGNLDVVRFAVGGKFGMQILYESEFAEIE